MTNQPGHKYAAYLIPCIYFLVCFLIIFLCLRKVSSLDIGFHLHAGKWILQNGSFPGKDAFSFTAGTGNYLDFNWLYQVLLYTVFALLGYPGIVVLNTLLVMASFAIVIVRCRIYGMQLGLRVAFLLMLSTLAMSVIYEVRPHIVSWLMLNLVLLCLENYTWNKKVKSLYALPFIMLLWVNLHSLFILGIVCLICFYLASWWKQPNGDPRLSKACLLSLAACLINPYTYNSLIYPLRQFKLLDKTNPFNQSISELSSSLNIDNYLFYGNIDLFHPLFPYHILVVILIWIFFKRMKKLPLHALLITVAFTYIGFSAVKNVGYHLFAVLPYMLLFSISPEWKLQSKWRVPANVGGAVVLLLLLVALLVSIKTDRFYIAQRFPAASGLGINETDLPVKGTAFISEKKITGNILNHLNFGSYLMFATPNKTFIDGRLEVFGEAFYKKYLKLFEPNNTNDFKETIEKYDIQALFFPYEISAPWMRYLKNNTDWRLVYFDELAAIYLKNNYRPDIKTVNSTFAKNMVNTLTITKPHDYYINMNYDKHFFKQQYFPYRERAVSFFCYVNGWEDEAIKIAEYGQVNATTYYPEMVFNLGTYFYQKKLFREALLCYNRFLKGYKHPLATKRIAVILNKQDHQP